MTKGYGWVQESVLNAAEEGDGWSGSFISAMNRFKDESYVIYLGELDEDIKLQCGRTLQAGVPLCIDLTTYNGKGNIYLHGATAKVAQKIVSKDNPNSFILGDALGANISGVHGRSID